MSPEQARGEPTDERTDLYALGVILFQMLTGEKLYVGDTTQAILDQHSHAPLPKLAAHLIANQPLLDRLPRRTLRRGSRTRASSSKRSSAFVRPRPARAAASLAG